MTAKATMQATYQGRYVNDIVHMLVASAVSGQHSVLLSRPGYGKTRIARTLSRMIAEDGAVMVRLEGSTPPEVVKGAIDPAAALDSPPRIVYVTTGTPFDPNAKIVLADEIFRPNDVVFDTMLQALDRQDVEFEFAPVVWGTSNFVVKSDRVEAILDRIALWQWIQPDDVQMQDFVRSVLTRKRGDSLGIATNGIPIPTVEDIERVRSYMPSNKTADVVAKKLSDLEEEAESKKFVTNPRRRTQWTEIVYRMSAFLYGDANFDEVHPGAARVLRWAWPTITQDEWVKWSEVANTVADPVGLAIDTLYAEALEALSGIKSSNKSTGERAIALGTILARAQRSLGEFGNDPRAKVAIDDLAIKFREMAQDIQGTSF